MTRGEGEREYSISRHSKSFSLASRFLPGPVRERAIAVYAWCRRADDSVDLAPPEVQADALERLRAELRDLYSRGVSKEPVLEIFRRAVEECGIPEKYPAELLDGMSMDVQGRTYETLTELFEYCHRVAGVVGLMMCHVMGVRDDGALRNAAHLGMAMQLTNICRDVLEDWERGRLYLPARLLSAHGAADLRDRIGGPLPRAAQPAVAGAVRELLVEADALYRSGDAGVSALSWRNEMAIRTARRVYSAIGSRVLRAGCDPFAGRAFVPLSGKLAMAASAVAETLLKLPVRMGRGGVPMPPSRIVRFPQDVLPVDTAA